MSRGVGDFESAAELHTNYGEGDQQTYVFDDWGGGGENKTLLGVLDRYEDADGSVQDQLGQNHQQEQTGGGSGITLQRCVNAGGQQLGNPGAGENCHYNNDTEAQTCLLYTSPSPRDKRQSRMPSSA